MSKKEAISLKILDEFREGKITRLVASELLGCSQRAVTRRVKKLREQGVAGIKHGNFQTPSVRRIDPGKREQMMALAKKLYFGSLSFKCKVLK